MATETLTISRLAQAAEVNVETVRYYQRRGLLPEPARPSGRIRRYGDVEVGRLLFIRRAKKMGFTLGEITDLLTLDGDRSCEKTLVLTEQKLADVRRRLEDLQQLERDLTAMAAECSQVPVGASCPTLTLLQQTVMRPRSA